MNHLGTLEHHYQDPEQPFGFIFGPPEEPAPVPDAPAAGEPLLNDIELNNSNQFFDRFQHDFNLWDDPKLLETLESFNNEPLQSFHGISVTLPQSGLSLASPTQNLDFTSFGHDLTARFGQAQLSSPTSATHPSLQNLDHFSFPQQASQDGLDLKNRNNAHMFKTQEIFNEQRRHGSRPASGRHSVPALVQDRSKASREMTNLTGLQFGDDLSKRLNEDNRRKTIPGVNFGSDTAFRNSQYEAPGSNLLEVKSREAIFRENLKTFESQWSGESTAPSSPSTATKRRLSAVVGTIGTGFNAVNGTTRSSDSQGYEDDRAKRQKKSRNDEEDDASDESSPGSATKSSSATRPAKRPSSKHKGRTLSEGQLQTPGRRKSQPSEPKPPRQNLTEEEKKQNHIRSEQKRRNQIREGFSNLTTMMPDASSNNLSKCAILSHAVDWLSGLIEGNQKLRAQLASMSS